MGLPSIDPPLTDDADRSGKIQALRDMIVNAERTIQGAKVMLLQLEGKKKTGRPKKLEGAADGTIIEGAFDGQLMLGSDGKQYPVPANYASKSKLVQGDMLKLTITPDGSFVYKQIGPIERRHAIGIVSQDESGNYHVLIDGSPYRVLLASITYFRVDPGDEVAVVMPRDMECSWVAIENILQKGSVLSPPPLVTPPPKPKTAIDDWKKDLEPGNDTPSEIDAASAESSPLDDWVRDMQKLESEQQAQSNNSNVS